MNKEEFLQKLKEIKIKTADEFFFLEYNAVVYDILEENEKLKYKLDRSEKARIDAIHYIRTELLCFDNESIEYIEGLKILNELDIDKGE